MADLRRLGKRGSYRLGRLGGPRPVPSAPPAPHYPSFAPHHRGPAGLWLLACLAGVAIVAAGALAGWWFLPFLAGLAGGLAAHYGRWRLRVSLPAVMLISAAVAMAVTLVVAALQAAVGLWLGRALAPGHG